MHGALCDAKDNEDGNMWCVQCGEPKPGEPQPQLAGTGIQLVPIEDRDLKPAAIDTPGMAIDSEEPIDDEEPINGGLKPASIPRWRKSISTRLFGSPETINNVSPEACQRTTKALSMMTEEEKNRLKRALSAKPKLSNEQRL